ncbi:hypothetical protein EVAR_2501_1 [Eumeta japonica]|uniref:Histone-lysine N-methyltransferase SETMAR n=1 Tax=Eumeta variegata TaxID=151549 RepID=A0A4C1SPE3_EUMVA|nr:hypothetical protein EVAR_2501_1 [Eumeta japonica]
MSVGRETTAGPGLLASAAMGPRRCVGFHGFWRTPMGVEPEQSLLPAVDPPVRALDRLVDNPCDGLQTRLQLNEFRDGRPTAVSNENIATVRRMIETDKHVKYNNNKTKYVATVALENYYTVNNDWYTTICFPEVIDELRKNIHNLRIILHDDNASSNTAKQSNKFLKKKHVGLMSNSSYSPNLIPYDFFCSQKLRINYAVNDFHHQKKLSKRELSRRPQRQLCPFPDKPSRPAAPSSTDRYPADGDASRRQT